MSVEQVTYISDLEPARPQGGDSIAQGDDHIRNIKKALKQTFPNIDGEVLVSDEELNDVMNAINTIRDEYEASFDDEGRVIATGMVRPDEGTKAKWSFTMQAADGNDANSNSALIAEPLAAGEVYAAVDIGQESNRWRNVYCTGVDAGVFWTDAMTMFGRSIWGRNGGGIYIGEDANVYAADDAAGRTDGISNLGNNLWRWRNGFFSGNILGRSALSDEPGVALTVSDVITSFEAIKASAERASTIEELRGSIVETMGELIAQMRDKQDAKIAELRLEGDQE